MKSSYYTNVSNSKAPEFNNSGQQRNLVSPLDLRALGFSFLK